MLATVAAIALPVAADLGDAASGPQALPRSTASPAQDPPGDQAATRPGPPCAGLAMPASHSAPARECAGAESLRPAAAANETLPESFPWGSLILGAVALNVVGSVALNLIRHSARR